MKRSPAHLTMWTFTTCVAALLHPVGALSTRMDGLPNHFASNEQITSSTPPSPASGEMPKSPSQAGHGSGVVVDARMSKQLVPYKHGRGLTTVYVSSFADLKSEVETGSATTIEVEAGTYTCSSDCYDSNSMLQISRSVNIVAKDGDGTVVLDGSDARRVILIETSGITVGLTGLNITNGRKVVSAFPESPF